VLFSSSESRLVALSNERNALAENDMLGFYADSRLSIARVHVALGLVYLFVPLVTRMTTGGMALFLVGVIVLSTGAAALPLEATLERIPVSLRAWLATKDRALKNAVLDERGLVDFPHPALGQELTPSPQQVVPNPAQAYKPEMPGLVWSQDISVLQLLLGVIVAPVAVSSIGWRAVLISAISEIVYLAYLGTRIIKTHELAELAAESQRMEESRRNKKHRAAPPEEAEAATAERRTVRAGRRLIEVN
jgi:hypothetical protein